MVTRTLLACLAVGLASGLAPAQAITPPLNERVGLLERRVAALEAAPPRCIKTAEAVQFRVVRLDGQSVRVLVDAPERNGPGRFWLALVHRSCMRDA